MGVCVCVCVSVKYNINKCAQALDGWGWATIKLRRSNCPAAVVMHPPDKSTCLWKTHVQLLTSGWAISGHVIHLSDTNIIRGAFRQLFSVAAHVLVTWTTSWIEVVTFWFWTIGQHSGRVDGQKPALCFRCTNLPWRPEFVSQFRACPGGVKTNCSNLSL